MSTNDTSVQKIPWNHAVIHDMHDATRYLVDCREQCRDDVDRSAYDSYLEHHTIVTMGSVVVEHWDGKPLGEPLPATPPEPQFVERMPTQIAMATSADGLQDTYLVACTDGSLWMMGAAWDRGETGFGLWQQLPNLPKRQLKPRGVDLIEKIKS